MLETLFTIIIFILMFVWSSLIFILANIDRIFKEDDSMDKNVIKVKADKDGKYFITLYGTRYQIVLEETKPATKPAKADKE